MVNPRLVEQEHCDIYIYLYPHHSRRFYNSVDSSHTTFGTINVDLHRSSNLKVFPNKRYPAHATSDQRPCAETHFPNGGVQENLNKPIDPSNAYRCLATDVIAESSLPRGHHMRDSPDFAARFNRVLRDFAASPYPWHIPDLHARPAPGGRRDRSGACGGHSVCVSPPRPSLTRTKDLLAETGFPSRDLIRQAIEVFQSESTNITEKSYPTIRQDIHNNPSLPPSPRKTHHPPHPALSSHPAAKTTRNALGVIT